MIPVFPAPAQRPGPRQELPAAEEGRRREEGRPPPGSG